MSACRPRGETLGAPDHMFITFEGGEGAGKSTQVARLAARLINQGHDVVLTREPGGSPRAERLREALLAGRARRLGPTGEAILFAAARADHVHTTIAPALARGAVVLCDRFTDSTRVYQGEGAGVTASLLGALERIAVRTTRPDLTVILDLPAASGLSRAQARRGGEPDRFEAESLAFHETVRQAFLRIAAAEPVRCVVVDAGREPDAIAADIWKTVSLRLLSSDHRTRDAA